MIIFDIETSPLPIDEIEQFAEPFDEAGLRSELDKPFDPASVKLGNLKDKDKIAAKHEAARAEHEAARGNIDQAIEQARAARLADLLDKAALSPLTGRVLVIGYYSPDKGKLAIDAGEAKEDDGFPSSEARMLAGFWKRYRGFREQGRSMVGLNIHDFDLPFMLRRSWILGVDVPPTVIEQQRFWDRVFVDLRKVWLCGQYGNPLPSNFDAIGKAMGTGGKNGQSGADFARLWREDREAAIEYLANDLKQPAQWAVRMGVAG